MENDKINICVISTPFQLRVLKKVLPCDSGRVIIYKTNIISDSEVEDYFENSKIYLFSENGWSLGNFVNGLPKSIYSYRNRVNHMVRLIDDDLSNMELSNCFVNIFIPSEKMIFSQILWSRLIKKLLRKKINYVALEEGTRYYVEENTKDYLLKLVYPISCYLLFGFFYKYYNRLGTNPQIDMAYVRYPEYLPRSYKKTAYKKLIFDDKNRAERPTDRDSILVITTPFSEDNLASVEREKAFLIKVLVFCKNEIGLSNIFIKPHPREKIEKYENLGVEKNKILDSSVCIEDMDYFGYTKVVNFGSSAVLEMIANSYPLTDIYTIESNFFKVNFLRKLFHQTVFSLEDDI